MLQHLGFAALASSSSAFAWTGGRPDYSVGVDDVLAHLAELCAAVDLPVNADFESGFAREAEGVAANVRRAVATGVAGLSIEDRDPDRRDGLYDLPLAIARVHAARAALDATGANVVLVARTEGLLSDPRAVAPAIERLVAFADAGADCLYAPGVRAKEDIAAIVRAVAPKPVNALMSAPGLGLADLAALGVRRVSVGGALARVAWAATVAAAREMRVGSFTGLAGAMPGTELNDIFKAFV